jgi:uncharacterized membrane protein YphA (DoxX/SURF4 family)
MTITAANQSYWSFYQKLGFRFFCCLFLIYIFPFPLDSIPFINEISGISEKMSQWYGAIFEGYTALWHAIIPWFAKHVLHLEKPITIFSNGSGDTTYDYILLLFFIILAFLGSIVWSVLDRKRPSYNQAHYWLRAALRYYLAGMMFVYGIIKIFHLQMPFPYLSQLVQPFGDKSPMGLAWSFIGYSKGYSAFSGIAELIGGILLLFRRTTLVGAITVAIVMLNVAMLNYFYDVPVKLFSTMLVIMSVFLIVPDLKRLGNLFFFNKPVSATTFPSMLSSRKLRITRVLLKFLIISSLFYSNISNGISSTKSYGDKRELPPLYGIYNSEIVVRNGDTIPPLTTDTTRWRQLIIQFKDNAQVKIMNDSLKRFNFEVDTVAKQVQLYQNNDTLNRSMFTYKVDSNELVLNGVWNKDTLFMKFRKYDINKFRLVSRGFNWINEYPYNR